MNAVLEAESPRRLLFIVSVTMLPILLLVGLTGAIKAEPEDVGPFCEQAANLVLNHDFEADPYDKYWVQFGNPSINCWYDTDFSAYEGNSAAAIYAFVGGQDCMLYQDEITVQGRRFYDLSAWLKVDSGAAARVAVSFWRLEDLVPTLIEEVSTSVYTETQEAWVQATVSAEAPSGAEYARVELIHDALSQAGESVSFDEIYFGHGTCLEIVKYGDPPEVSPLQSLTYTIVYSNTGRDRATGVVVEEIYDDNVQFQWSIPEPFTGTNNSWEVGELAAGGRGVITAVVWVTDTAVYQNWLVNMVSINAEEIVEPVSADPLYTGIDTDGVCAIDLLAVPTAQTGKPGQVVDYDLELLNVGLFPGEAELTAGSDLGLGITFDSVTYTLSVSGFASAAMQIYVPSTVTIPSTDTTWITATLSCEGDLQDDAAEWVSTDVVFYTQLMPTLMKDHCGVGPWEVEPNDSFEQAYGPLCLEKELYGYPDDNSDYFLVYAPDGGIIVDLYSGAGDIPPSEGIQLAVCPPDAVFSSDCTWDSVPEDGYHLELPGISGLYYILVYKPEPFSISWTYTLIVSPF
jgi:uncharacterized repeat protein (TIGR01451 family)